MATDGTDGTQDTAELHPAPAAARRAVAAYFLVQGASFAVLVTRIPALQDRFALTEAGLALLLLLVPVVAGVGSIAAGSLAARVGSAAVLRATGPAVPLAVLLAGLAPTLPLLLGALVLVGLGLGAVDAAMNMQAVDCQDAYGRPIVASFFAVWSLAGIVGALAASVAAGSSLSLGSFFAIAAALLVPVDLVAGRWLMGRDVQAVAVAEAVEGPPVAIVLPADAGAPADPAPSAPSGGPPWRPIVLIGLAVTALFVCDSTVSNWSAVYVSDTLGGGDEAGPLAYAAYAAAMLVGRLVADRWVARSGPVRVVRGAGLLAAVAALGVVAAPGVLSGVAAFALLGLALSPVLPQAFSAAGAYDAPGTGTAVARVNVFNYVGFVVGAPLVGVLGDATGLRAAMLVLVPVALVITALAGAFGPRRVGPSS